MTELLKVSKVNEVYIQLHANLSVINQARDYFTYFVPSAKYDLRYINKMWDGKIRLLKPNNCLYYGLLDEVIKFTQEFGYTIEISQEIRDDNISNLNDEETDKWIAGLNLRGKNNTKITSFSYQVAGFKHAITRSRCVLECPTGSGKSLMIYKFCRKFLDDNYKILLVVPRKSLVEQLFKDFQTYSHYNKWDTDKYVQKLYGGLDKNFHKDVLITTWQSIRTNHHEFFKQFDVVIGDEAHHFTAKSLIKIMESLSNAKYRIGTTGTADTEIGLDSKIKV
ncbi:MAG: DEAD/DEAH box helicase family protein, partial [Endozoicomonadaceae bacterium]|nr:DEAD/DEAH box helicase family protein [Endozoicomonadaceae bacterium]